MKHLLSTLLFAGLFLTGCAPATTTPTETATAQESSITAQNNQSAVSDNPVTVQPVAPNTEVTTQTAPETPVAVQPVAPDTEVTVQPTAPDTQVTVQNTAPVTPVPVQPTTSTSQNTIGEVLLSQEEAKQIALNHAGVAESNANFFKCSLDYDDGVPEYEVEFYVGNMEYDYEIHAKTGNIISFDHEIDDDIPTTTPTEPSVSTTLSSNDATTIALNHAGLTASQVQSLKCELDYDDGVQKFDVEFKVGKTEYEYEIHGTSGAILSFDRDED